MDTTLLSSAAQLSDDALLSRVEHLAAREREATMVLIAHLAELEKRELHLREGYSSLYAYCTQALHLSEYAAYGRIAAARAVRRFPVLLELLAEGAVTPTTVELLAPHLTEANHREVLETARYQSKRQVQEIIARLHPRPDAPASVHRLPGPRTMTVAAPAETEPATQTPQSAEGTERLSADLSSARSPAEAIPALELVAAGLSSLIPAGPAASTRAQRLATIEPLAPERYRVQVTIDKETYEQLRFAQALLRHQFPDGDMAEIFRRAVGALVEDLLKEKVAATERPREKGHLNPHSRHIPAEVKRAVWARDGGRCAFMSRSGRRCMEEGFLEFHHVNAYADGGKATVENIELRCRAHNGYEAVRVLGRRKTHMVREHPVSYAVGDPPQNTGPAEGFRSRHGIKSTDPGRASTRANMPRERTTEQPSSNAPIRAENPSGARQRPPGLSGERPLAAVTMFATGSGPS